MNNSHRNFDSNGPDVKIRGTATNIFERYCQLARDANASGDRVAAENYLQHAEHYYRIMLAQGVTPMQRAANQQQQAAQLEAVLKGTRKVSEDFRKDVTQQYLATHGLFGKMFAHEKKVYDDNNENTLQKEIVDFLDECFKFGHERFDKLGYQHKLVNKDNHEWSLEKK